MSFDRRTLLGGVLALGVCGPTLAAARTSQIKVALLGQSLIQHDVCLEPWPGMASLARLLRQSDVVFTDLETAIAGPLAGSSTRDADSQVLHVAQPAVIDCLGSFGVNVVATSNNHAWDLGSGGIIEASSALDARRITHAGSGRDIEAASAAGVRATAHGRLALVAAAAGAIAKDAAATATRAGVNELRRKPDGALDPDDVARSLAAIRNARSDGANVLAYLHNHYWEEDTSITPAWQRGYARACVDAGAALFVAHGPPLLQGIEVYRGAPLFHGLGNFIFQTRKPEGSYGPATWQSFIVEATLSAGRFVAARLLPVLVDSHLVAESSGSISRGVPSLARGVDAKEIIASMLSLSRRLGYTPRQAGLALML